MTYVVDTSVFVRWWVRQVGWEHAQQIRESFLAGEVELVTPEFTRIEHAEVLRKKGFLGNVLDFDEYLAAVQALDVMGVEMVTLTQEDLARAAALGANHSLRMFDAIGASLALDRGLTLLTADAKCALAVANVVDVEVLKGV
jgi:predicted nucleic acid-binding protein